MQLDVIDIKILEYLQEDCRITQKELSNKLGISTTPIFERIRKLEKNGYIKEYVAIINPEKVNRKLTAFISATLKEHTKSQIDLFISNIGSLPEVIECYHMAGSTDFLIKVKVTDMDAYHDLIVNKISVMEDCVANLQSPFALAEVKNTTTISLDHIIPNSKS